MSSRARALRKQSSWAEKLMWRWLRDRRFTNYKFRRQHPLGNYYLDFYCEEARLSIELDGFNHGRFDRRSYDAERTRFIQTLGIKELRFWNHQLRREPQYVRDCVFTALQQRAPHPLPEYTRPGFINPTLEKSSPSPRPSPPGEGEHRRLPVWPPANEGGQNV
jgi:very-short-patch-repair endonuclease